MQKFLRLSLFCLCCHALYFHGVISGDRVVEHSGCICDHISDLSGRTRSVLVGFVVLWFFGLIWLFGLIRFLRLVRFFCLSRFFCFSRLVFSCFFRNGQSDLCRTAETFPACSEVASFTTNFTYFAVTGLSKETSFQEVSAVQFPSAAFV